MQGPSRQAAAAAERALDATLSAWPEAASRRQLAAALHALVDLLDREVGLRRSLADPTVPVDVRAALVDRLLVGRTDDRAVGLLRALLAERWSRPIDLVDSLEELATASIFAAAESDGVLDEVEDELFRFGRILDQQPALYAGLDATGVPADRRAELVRSLLADRAHPDTVEVVTRAVTAPRGRPLDRALADAVALAARRRDRLLATVTSAVPLDDDRVARLAQGLAGLYGRPVQLQLEVDPGLLGGLVVRIGDEVLDASVVRRLGELRQRLAGRG